MSLDIAIDPLTGDAILSADGSIAMVDHAGTALILQLRSRLGEWWGDSTAGGRLHDLKLFQSDPARMIADEAKRCLGWLVTEGRITDLVVTATDGGPGRVFVRTECRDVASGRRVDLSIPVGAT